MIQFEHPYGTYIVRWWTHLGDHLDVETRWFEKEEEAKQFYIQLKVSRKIPCVELYIDKMYMKEWGDGKDGTG